MGFASNTLGGKSALGVLVLMACISLVCVAVTRHVMAKHMGGHRGGKRASFAVNNGGEIDDVNNPVYNALQLIKQSVLLEEHLNNPRKRCGACIVKHFSHLDGLAEEAVSLAGEKVAEFPLLGECPQTYQSAFAAWRKCRNNPKNVDGTCREVADRLRKMRRELTKTYVLDGSYQ